MTADLSLLTRVAQELITRVRDDDPEANARWLSCVLPDRTDWFRLSFLLAAAVPDDRTWTELTAWFTGDADRTDARRRQWREANRRAAA